MIRAITVVWQLFVRSSRIQRKRAVLTIASIAWGTVALILLLAFGQGLNDQIRRNSAGMGENIAVIFPGETTKPYQGLPPGRPIRPIVEDVQLLRERVPGIDEIVGEMRAWGVSFTYGRKTVNGRANGTTPEFGELRNHIPRAGGRFLTELDEQQRRRVVFLGAEVARDVFGAEEPVGRTVLLNNTPYTVVGVMIKKIQMGTYGGPDTSGAVIPLSTFKAQFNRERLTNLVMRPQDPERMKEVLTKMREVLAAKYGFDPKDEPAVGVWDTVESGVIMRNILLGIQIFLGIIGGLTLMIGGVGVANIMYATVKERTREIGVKMALGARPAWVTAPLVLEGVSYTVFGGLLGLIGATALIALIGALPTEGNEALEFLGKPVLSPGVGIASAAILGAIGLLAAYFPARRAASIDPAQTLRYE
jgi:putative ABC transport system permease protein